MKRLILAVVVNAGALWIADLLVAGVRFGRGDDLASTVTTIALVAVIFGVFDAIANVARVVAAPFILLSLGLVEWAINAGVLLVVSAAAERLGLAFHVDGFWWDAVWGALVVSIASWVLRALLPKPKK